MPIFLPKPQTVQKTVQKIEVMNNIALRYVYDRKKRATDSRPEWLLIEVRQIVRLY